MRTVVGVALVTVCLGLAGCSLFGKKQSAKNAPSRPFTGTETPAQRETAAADPAAPLTGVNGLLAGRVLDQYNRPQSKVFIQVVDLEDTRPTPAKLEVETKQSYFTIPGLKVGHHYQLIARVQDGGRLLSGTTTAMPPNPRLSIFVSEDNNSPGTPPIPEPGTLPDKKGGHGTGGVQDKGPAATLDPPRKATDSPTRPGDTGTSSNSNGMGISQPPSGNPPNLTNIADGFTRAPISRPANVPNPYQSLPYQVPPPPEAKWSGIPDDRPGQPAHPSLPPMHAPPAHLSTGPARVPSCVLVGNRLENFALYDLDQRPWEYRRDRTGKLVLLDFWYTSCPACLDAIHHLVELQKSYGPYGLQVIGIACETNGTPQQQAARIRGARIRYRINYLTLLSGGGFGACPVVSQFQVEYFPKLVLIDDSGMLLWSSTRQGLDDYALRVLEFQIQKKLNVYPH